MRNLFRLLGVCLLVLIPFFACMDFDLGEPPEGCGSYDWGDGSGWGDGWDWGDGSDGPDGPYPTPDPCQGVVCPDDGDECTEEYCSGGAGGFGGSGGAGGFGGSGGADGGGVCVDGVCVEMG